MIKFKVTNFLALHKHRECVLVFLFKMASRKCIFCVGNRGFINCAIAKDFPAKKLALDFCCGSSFLSFSQ